MSLIPAFGTLYQRLTLPESTRYKKSQEADVVEQDDLEKEKMGVKADVHATESDLNVDRGASVPKKSHVLGMVPCRISSLVSWMF